MSISLFSAKKSPLTKLRHFCQTLNNLNPTFLCNTLHSYIKLTNALLDPKKITVSSLSEAGKSFDYALKFIKKHKIDEISDERLNQTTADLLVHYARYLYLMSRKEEALYEINEVLQRAFKLDPDHREGRALEADMKYNYPGHFGSLKVSP
ncbi:MAG: hypothetical protein V4496_03190 [Pseudomonadota bacterium]